ncbi:MAG TPA: phosphohistidine phosphatase SixA [Verrucomicrobiae bacterium]|nr:phosphohistidine phosphatase SixA [Verrucomicrobiae bacterium]
MNLYILRHGLAVEREDWDFKDDSQRPLTPQGKKQLKSVARAMEKMELHFDLILSSPFLRVKQTAEIVTEILKLKKRLKFSDALMPDGDATMLIHQLNRLKPSPKNLLLVGHEPYLSRLISLLISGEENAALDFKKGGLCKLEVENLRAGKCAMLVWLLTPKQMKLMN